MVSEPSLVAPNTVLSLLTLLISAAAWFVKEHDFYCRFKARDLQAAAS